MKRWIGPLLGLTIALSLTLIAGENPLQVALILWRGTFGSLYDFGLTLSYAVPLVFTGLSVAVAFHAGLFNIGAEGQLLMAAAAAAGTGVLLPQIPAPFAPILATLFALTAGGLWGGLAGWLKAARGSHEVIVTILLNFVASGITSWFILGVIPNPNSQNPESAPVAGAYRFTGFDPVAAFFPDSGANLSLLIAIVAAALTWVILRRSVWGFEIGAVGQNAEAARRSGIPVERRWMQAMMLAGVLAGGVALAEILGRSGQFKLGFSPEYGFIGIAVALLAGNNPLGILLAAFFMGALHKGAADLDLETDTITRDFSKVIQALIILGVGLRFRSVWPWGKK